MIGDGPLRQELVGLTKQLGLEQRVHFLGFRSDVCALIELLLILLVPSLSEGSLLVVLEAMSAGIPILASAVGDIPDQIEHESEGLLVPLGDPVVLSDALLSLLHNPAYAHNLGRAGRSGRLPNLATRPWCSRSRPSIASSSDGQPYTRVLLLLSKSL